MESSWVLQLEFQGLVLLLRDPMVLVSLLNLYDSVSFSENDIYLLHGVFCGYEIKLFMNLQNRNWLDKYLLNKKKYTNIPSFNIDFLCSSCRDSSLRLNKQ